MRCSCLHDHGHGSYEIIQRHCVQPEGLLYFCRLCAAWPVVAGLDQTSHVSECLAWCHDGADDICVNQCDLTASHSYPAQRIFKRKINFQTVRRCVSSIWLRWFDTVMKRPIRMTLLGTGILLFCLLPVRQLEMAIPDATSLPATIESRQAAERCSRFSIKTSLPLTSSSEERERG